MNSAIELEQEDDGRRIAEIDELNGVSVYGESQTSFSRAGENRTANQKAERLA